MAELTDQEADEVRVWLGRNQFQHIASVGGPSEAFGDQQDTWERDGTTIRLSRDRGQWWYEMSRVGSDVWLDVDKVVAAMGYNATGADERVAMVSWIDDRVFDALLTADGFGQ